MWQIILFIVLSIVFIVMFLLGLAILKTKAEEAEPDQHPSTDRATRAERASRHVGSRWDMTPEERRLVQQSDVFTGVTSRDYSASLSDIQQIMNSTPPPESAIRSSNDFWSGYTRGAVTPTPRPEPKPISKPEPEEVIPKRESINAIDDLDLS